MSAAPPAWATVYQWSSVESSPSISTRAVPTIASTTSIDALIAATASRYADARGVRAAGLDGEGWAALLEALVWRESAFDPSAVSAKGAMGLGQLMPRTAAELGVRDPVDAASNLDGAARYLSRQLASFGSVPLALAAYNAGPSAVRRYGGIPPFPETQSYVAAIERRLGRALEPSRVATRALPQGQRAQRRNPQWSWQY